MSFREDALAFINSLEAWSESNDLNEPASVLITDPETGTKSITGPYPNGYAAFDAMEKLRAKGGFPPGCEFEVVPTWAPKGEWA